MSSRLPVLSIILMILTKLVTLKDFNFKKLLW